RLLSFTPRPLAVRADGVRFHCQQPVVGILEMTDQRGHLGPLEARLPLKSRQLGLQTGNPPRQGTELFSPLESGNQALGNGVVESVGQGLGLVRFVFPLPGSNSLRSSRLLALFLTLRSVSDWYGRSFGFCRTFFALSDLGSVDNSAVPPDPL